VEGRSLLQLTYVYHYFFNNANGSEKLQVILLTIKEEDGDGNI